VIRHNAGWISNPNPVEPMRNASTRCARAAAKTSDWQRSVLPRNPTPPKPDYWRALDDLGFGRVALLLPTLRKDESLRLLDDHAAMVERYRG
jgi:hypothetical protein